VDRATSELIDLVEAAYNLEVESDEWLPRVMDAGLPVLDQGLGVGALSFLRPLDGSKVVIHQHYVASGPEDFAERNMRFTSGGSAEVSQAFTKPGMAVTLTEVAGDKYVEDVERWRRHFDYSRDAFGLTAVDPNGQGVFIIAPLAEVTRLDASARTRWQMVGAHMAAGHRLRIAAERAREAESPELPHDAEAVIDPKGFRISDAAGGGRSKSAANAVREAARRADRARGKLRESDPQQALEIWRGLSRGRWTLVDWFDTDSRRYVLAIPNPPELRDPRGLTERENQVVTYATLGDSHKLIAYRLGVSRSTVTKALRSAMSKLGVSTQAELVAKMAPMPRESEP
jgi:DNA-binding CsgD family transcriptional regulator